ncbi:MAG TPA: FMN-binding protein [Candidatus Rifleibacterium sp.]|nr:FMN-binding protein [Candidatus Rifleibacterium sp.]HPT45888.1 FMN-binding protein [Candidatus Rifleibacterium sp.]
MSAENIARSPTGFMLLLAFCCSLLLMFTRASIGERAEVSLRSIDALLQIAGAEILPVEEQLLEHFDRMFVRRTGGRIKLWQGIARPDLWACEATGNGMWAEITLVFIYDKTSGQLQGLRVVDQNETAGLGSLITDEAFTDQFAGITARQGVALAAARVMSNQFDAVTGATTSSRAVEKLLNRAMQQLHAIWGSQ